MNEERSRLELSYKRQTIRLNTLTVELTRIRQKLSAMSTQRATLVRQFQNSEITLNEILPEDLIPLRYSLDFITSVNFYREQLELELKSLSNQYDLIKKDHSRLYVQHVISEELCENIRQRIAILRSKKNRVAERSEGRLPCR